MPPRKPAAPTRRAVLGTALAVAVPLETVQAQGASVLRVSFPALAVTLDPAKFRTGGEFGR